MDKLPNNSIGCNVKSCQYHCNDVNYCSLSKISVTTHEENPTEIECTDCGSFKMKKQCC